ncbi:hypothetical protein EIP91_002731 [Steccherinum ochraceum]|uniref:MYND-type domain-containing protein n=1 Tax=Steccherinum ochraceum TaxID=92696 RepID=A0A4V2MWB6_9APHY|nr:hypothetical protein EIP91_002731 [Steccherinum ochraceum]
MDQLDTPFRPRVAPTVPFGDLSKELPSLLAVRREATLPDSLLAVPTDLKDEFVWVLRVITTAYAEAHMEDLVAAGLVADTSDASEIRVRELLYPLRERLILALFDHPAGPRSQIAETMPLMEKQMDNMLFLSKCPGSNLISYPPWKYRPGIYARYGVSRVRECLLDRKTQEVLELALNALQDSSVYLNVEPYYAHTRYAVMIPIHLSLVLDRLGTEPEKQKQYTEKAVKYLRKNRHLRSELALWLENAEYTPHPVTVALGSAWFRQDPIDDKNINRIGKRCGQCNATEMQKRLSLCKACKYVFYCSKECQKLAWALHKSECKSMSYLQARTRNLREIHSPLAAGTDAILNAAEKIGRWDPDSKLYANRDAFICALRLHEDIRRSRTHVVIRQLEFLPNSPSSFRVAEWGTYAIEDVVADIAIKMSKTEAEMRDTFARIFIDAEKYAKDPEAGTDAVPVVVFDGVKGVNPAVIRGRCSFMSETNVRATKYNPNWRDKVNSDGTPPAQISMSMSRGAVDVEYRVRNT